MSDVTLTIEQDFVSTYSRQTRYFLFSSEGSNFSSIHWVWWIVNKGKKPLKAESSLLQSPNYSLLLDIFTQHAFWSYFFVLLFKLAQVNTVGGKKGKIGRKSRDADEI